MSAPVPGRLGKYEVVREISRGNMGTVYLGHDPYLDRPVAIKVAHAEQLADKDSGAQFRKMFFNEAHTAGLLTHPNIIGIRDAGIDDQHCYIVMEYVDEGTTLKPFCKAEGLLPVERVAEIIFKCAKALDYAHRQGVIHRDIKPTNILVTDKLDVKIADFSIAYITKMDTAHTLVMGVAGSPRYMSPEQINDETLTPQTDIFSLGIIMYEMLTGRHPFMAESFPRLLQNIVKEDAAPMGLHRRDMPEMLERIVARALAKKPADRYATALDFATDLSKAFERLLEIAAEQIESEEMYNAVRKLEFFQEFTDEELRELMKVGSWLTADPGTRIIVEGEMDDSFYVIIEGEVSVRKGAKKLSALKRGDCIGEMGYLMRSKRTASIVAKTPTSLLKLNSTVMSQLPYSCQVRFLRVFMRTLIQRLTATIDRITQ